MFCNCKTFFKNYFFVVLNAQQHIEHIYLTLNDVSELKITKIEYLFIEKSFCIIFNFRKYNFIYRCIF